jgi:hypothetical protein
MEKNFKLKAYSFKGDVKRQFSTEEEARDFAAHMIEKFPNVVFEIYAENKIGLERRAGERRRDRDRRSGVDRRGADRRIGEERRSLTNDQRAPSY